MTVAEGAETYIQHLEAAGKSPSTCATTRRTLALLVAHLGADREVGEVVAKDLDNFFASEAATKLRGQPRAPASIAQLRVIVRAALAWWQHQGPRKPPPATTAMVAVPVPTSSGPTQPPVLTPTPAAVPPAAAPTRTTYLDLTYQGQPVRFAKTEIDRAHLYGVRKLIALDADGRECQTALLTRDGRYVLPTGSTADLYINECGDAVPRRDLVTARAPISAAPPTASVPPGIEGPLSAWELLDYAVTRVHALHPVVVPAKLAQLLRVGELFRVPYRSRPGAAETPAFLLGTETGAFLIQAEPHGFDLVGADQPALPENAPDEDDIDAFAFPDDFGGPDGTA